MAKNHPVSDKTSTSPLANACGQYDCLRGFHRVGLVAMRKVERQYISVPDTKLIGCSVALDEAAKEAHPLENRWDYAIEYDGNTFLIEIHPASTSEIECVILKAQFVLNWLKKNAPELLSLPRKETGARQFYWVSSGRTDIRILPNSRQAKKLALHHIKQVGRVWDYSKLFG